MAADLDTLFDECLRIIDSSPEHIACPRIVSRLSRFLPLLEGSIPDQNRVTLKEKVGGLTILGHHHPKSVWSYPHNHGVTWAIYGQAIGRTAMYLYEKIDEKNVRLVESYWILPGQSFWYPTGTIHSHQTYDDAKLIRIEGKNLWRKSNNAGGRRYTMI